MSSEMRELIQALRNGEWNMRAPQELADLLASMIERWYGYGKSAAASDDADEAFYTCAEELGEALLARTEAGPSLLCQSDTCAHKGTVHNFCTPRTEARADGGAPICLFDATNPCDGTCGECHHLRRSPAGTKLYTSPAHTSEARDANSARYEWLKRHISHADFEPADGVGIDLIFRLPTTCAISANLDATLDAAMRQEGSGNE